jgi:hypothetical protein
MKTRRFRKQKAKKAFITSAIVDIWAYIMFVLVVIVFSLIYKWTATAHLEQLEGIKDLSYGNYLAHIYLRSPIDVAGTEMTMAELLALYDYNMTLEKAAGRTCEFRPYDKYFYYCMDGPMGKTIVDITNSFMDDNLKDTHHIFIIKGSGFTYMNTGTFQLAGAQSLIDALLSMQIPKENYVTYVPSVDPTQPPIEIYFFYDFPRFLKSLAPEKRGIFTALGDFIG